MENKRILPEPVKKAGIWFFKDIVGAFCLRTSRALPVADEEVSLHLLMSGATSVMGLLALRSFERETGRTWRTFVHDDGTMSDKDVARVNRVAPNARVVRRAEADVRMGTFLAGYDSLASNRVRHPWFLKFLDCAAFAPYDDYIVLDTDVIFFHPPFEILDWASARPGSAHFMKDARETYCSPREEILKRTGLNLWDAVNSGICLMPKKAVDLSLADSFVRLFEEDAKHYIFLEQTLFAVAGAALGSGGTLPTTYEISWNTFRQRNSIARHYVGIIKHDLLYFEGATTMLFRSFTSPST